MDIDSIPFGVDYRKSIRGELLKSDILVVLIGPQWLGPTPGGPNRILNEADPIRVEVETALNDHIPIMPVLVDNAAMPAVQDLPESLSEMAFLNAAEVDTGRDFRYHIERLSSSIDQILADKGAPATAAKGALVPG
jgi:hypothetical protein